MNDANRNEQAPRGIRLLAKVGKEPDWSAMTPGDLAAFAQKQNRKRSSRLARIVTGRPDERASIHWQDVMLDHGQTRVRTYRPRQMGDRTGADRPSLPGIVHIHGGGFVGTAAQSDWINSYLAAALPAIVLSVEHRLLSPEIPLSAAASDCFAVLDWVAQGCDGDVDSDRIAVFGESTGGLIAALAAIRARDAGQALRAQILANPGLDLTDAGFEYPSMITYGNSPTLTTAQMRFFRELAVPPDNDPRRLSPLHADDLSRLPATLLVVPTLDPVADHARQYAQQLILAGTSTQVREYPGATHAFLSMPGLVPQARTARDDVVAFLSTALS